MSQGHSRFKERELSIMRIIFEVNECNDNELLEQMKSIRSYDDFAVLAYEYGWDECVDAFAAVNEYFDTDYITDQLYEALYSGEDVCSILGDAVTMALEEKYPKEKEYPKEPTAGTALAVLLDQIRNQKPANK